MIPVYLVGTLWLAEAYAVSFSQALEWGVTPFLLWDALKIVLLAVVTTKVLSFSMEDSAEEVSNTNE
jgi:biotin transporter BioY